MARTPAGNHRTAPFARNETYGESGAPRTRSLRAVAVFEPRRRRRRFGGGGGVREAGVEASPRALLPPAQEVVAGARREQAIDFRAQRVEVATDSGRSVQDGNVGPKVVGREQGPSEPRQHRLARACAQARRQMERRLVERVRHVPEPPRDVEHVALREEAGPERAGRHALGRGIALERLRPGVRVHLPPLPAPDLEDEHVMVVPVLGEAVVGTPAGVQVDVDAGVQLPLEPVSRTYDHPVQAGMTCLVDASLATAAVRPSDTASTSGGRPCLHRLTAAFSSRS